MSKQIILSPHLDFDQKKKAVNLALGLGFETISTSFPITRIEEQDNIDLIWDQWAAEKSKSASPPADYTSASSSAREVPPYDWRKAKGLEAIFSPGQLLIDNNFDLLADEIDLKIVISADSSIEIIAAACNFAFRLGMETTAYQGSIVADQSYRGNRIQFAPGEDFAIRYLKDGDAVVLEITGQGDNLIKSLSSFLEEFPQIKHGYSWSDFLMYLTDSLALRNTDGQLAVLQALASNQVGDLKALVSEQDEDRLEMIRSAFPAAAVESYKKQNLIYEKEYDIPWENDIFIELIEKNVLPLLKENDRLEIHGCVSENKNSRTLLTQAVEDKISVKNVSTDIRIINSYKQGVSWIIDFVLPEIKELPVDKIKIKFNSFLPPGEEGWTDEAASTPKYNMTPDGGADHWNDLPIRYLQELHPVDDLIEKELGLSRDKVEFAIYDGDEDLSYLLEVFDSEGSEIYSAAYTAKFSERPYLDRFPELGKVHPSTAYLEAKINGETVYQTNFMTDVERIWDIYQREVLEDCLDFCQGKYQDGLLENKQPFFALLDLDIKVSEPNERLGVREDLISSLDALHEDIYFAGTDFFKHVGRVGATGVLDAPGLILPRIEQRYGPASFKVRLYDQLAIEPAVFSARKNFQVKKRNEIESFIKSLSQVNNGWLVEIDVAGADPEITEGLAALGDSPLLEMAALLPGVAEIRLCSEAIHSVIFKQEKEDEILPLAIEDIDISESELIGYEEYSRIIKELERVPGLAVFPIAESYLGRKLHAIELIGTRKGYTSRVKRLTYLPSLYVNARHHANEVSGTNASFLLLKELLTDEKYRDLPDKLNLVTVPMENPDGAAIHYELQKTNPYWSFHVARFNAIGKEFYYDHFEPDTIHTEAMGLRKLWYYSLPDIMIDNHGVPTHEWVQQFSGYVYPAFKGFWLPRSLLYGYFWYVTDEAFAANLKVNKKMEEVIADSIAADTEMTELNLEWIDRFKKYATQFMPKMFAANYYRNMINYWIPFAHDPAHRYPSIRFPWIVTVAYTSEVADETAQGEYLNLCARSLVRHNLATIDMILTSELVYEVKKEITEDEQKLNYTRQRPILV